MVESDIPRPLSELLLIAIFHAEIGDDDTLRAWYCSLSPDDRATLDSSALVLGQDINQWAAALRPALDEALILVVAALSDIRANPRLPDEFRFAIAESDPAHALTHLNAEGLPTGKILRAPVEPADPTLN